MPRYCLQLSYNGAPFCGWQVQPDQLSIQEELEKALSVMLRETIAVTGCGRTDTGVHARNYFAHFDCHSVLDDASCSNLCHRLNGFLPKEIAIRKIFSVPENFHARFDATSRTYRYYVSTEKDPFAFDQSYFLSVPLDVETMNQAAQLLIGTHDFKSFSKVHTQVNNFICTVSFAGWSRQGSRLVFTISANRFLRNMVRAVVGTLLEVGKGKLMVSDFEDIMAQKNRCAAGTSVPAHALFLEDILY